MRWPSARILMTRCPKSQWPNVRMAMTSCHNIDEQMSQKRDDQMSDEQLSHNPNFHSFASFCTFQNALVHLWKAFESCSDFLSVCTLCRDMFRNNEQNCFSSRHLFLFTVSTQLHCTVTRAKRVGFFKFGSGRVRVLEKTSGSGRVRVRVLALYFLSIGYYRVMKILIGYFRVYQ